MSYQCRELEAERNALKAENEQYKSIICEFIAASELTGFSLSQETYDKARRIAEKFENAAIDAAREE